MDFDIGNIGQPLHRRHSELVPEAFSDIITKWPLKAVGHSLAAELEGHPKSYVWCIF